MNVTEPCDRTAFWIAAGTGERQQREVVMTAALLHRPDLAERHIDQLERTDFKDSMLSRIAGSAGGRIRLDGVADPDTMAGQLRRLHFPETRIGVQLDILARVSESLNQARVDEAAAWLRENRGTA